MENRLETPERVYCQFRWITKSVYKADLEHVCILPPSHKPHKHNCFCAEKHSLTDSEK